MQQNNQRASQKKGANKERRRWPNDDHARQNIPQIASCAKENGSLSMYEALCVHAK